MSAATKQDADTIRLGKLSVLAETLMPAFRDKYDFSDPKDFHRLSQISFQAADAMFKLQEDKLAEIEATYEKELAKEIAYTQAAIAKQKALDAAKEAANG